MHAYFRIVQTIGAIKHEIDRSGQREECPADRNADVQHRIQAGPDILSQFLEIALFERDRHIRNNAGREADAKHLRDAGQLIAVELDDRIQVSGQLIVHAHAGHRRDEKLRIDEHLGVAEDCRDQIRDAKRKQLLHQHFMIHRTGGLVSCGPADRADVPAVIAKIIEQRSKCTDAGAKGCHIDGPDPIQSEDVDTYPAHPKQETDSDKLLDDLGIGIALEVFESLIEAAVAVQNRNEEQCQRKNDERDLLLLKIRSSGFRSEHA